MAGRPKKEESEQSVQPQQVKIKWKGEKEFRHDRFELGVAQCKTNKSWKQFEPNIELKDHKHWFHSHDHKGRARTYCTPMSGHFHEVKTEVDADGNLIASCGPPMRRVARRMRNGTYRKVTEPVIFKGMTEDQDIHDDHRHIVTYDESEILSEKYKQSRASQDAQRLQMLQGTRMQGLSAAQKERESQAETQAASYQKLQNAGATVAAGGTKVEGLES